MPLLSTVLISFGLASDAFAASLALGSTYKKRIFIKALYSSALFGLFQGVMPIFGWVAGTTFKQLITSVDHWLAFILLTGIGIRMIMESFEEKETDKIDKVNFGKLISLAIATSIDALIVGVSLAFIGAELMTTILSIGSITFLLCLAGVFLGQRFHSLLKSKAGAFGGLVLILIGVKILNEHILLF